MTGILSDIIGLVIGIAVMPCYLNFYIGDGSDVRMNRKNFPAWYKLIYPKWLMLKSSNNYKYAYRIKQRISFIQERKSLKALGFVVMHIA